jgi:2-phospho-L-lactate guanylyltransferase
VTVAVVPVKELDAAKGRLSARLGPRERRELVLAMLEDVVVALGGAEGVSSVMVVTREPEIASMAHRMGAEVLEDPLQPGDGYSNAVARAVQELQRRHEPAILTVPGDVPAVTSQEITAILRAGDRAAVVLVPSRDERGTNAALVRPPGVLPLRFGEPSFVRHLAIARELGLRAEVLHLHGLSLDLDTPADLDEFLRMPSATHTYRLLAEQNRP